MDRGTLLVAAGAGLAGLSGCGSTGSPDGTMPTAPDTTPTPSSTRTPTETPAPTVTPPERRYQPQMLDVALVSRWATPGDLEANRVESVRRGPTVRGDPTRLQGLFENLFRNSVEHGSTDNRPKADDSAEHGSTDNRRAERAGDSVEHEPSGGAGDTDDASEHGGARGLSVAVGRLPGDDGFYVEDDGVGIPAEERERVLEFGYSTATDGTGVGLGPVVDIAEAHDWTVAATEADGGGARFEFEGVG